jgi:ubiquinone/menaquinone biosynthesis C-methylase UbiE
MSETLDRLGRRFARLTTDAVVARPALWPLFRGPLRAQFDRLASVWEWRLGPEALAPLAAALGRVPPPTRALDLGTGTGKGARLVAERFPDAEVLGVDLSPAMVAAAGRLLPPELAPRVAFEVGDASRLHFADRSFDLVVLLNMIPFFEELARVTAAGGALVVTFSLGPATPIWVLPATLRERLAPLGFEGFEELQAGTGTAFLAFRR